MDFRGSEERMNGTFIPIAPPVVNGHRIYILTAFRPDNNVNIIFYCILNISVSFFLNLPCGIKIVQFHIAITEIGTVDAAAVCCRYI